jgi:hypothetical protein
VQQRIQVLVLTAVIGLLAGGGGWAQVSDVGSPLVSEHIRYGSLSVEFDRQAGYFHIDSDVLGGAFVSRGMLHRAATGTRRPSESISHPAWGRGEALRIEHGTGGYDGFAVYSGLPFVVFESTIINDTQANMTLGSIRPASLTLGLPQGAGGLRALGTGGLTGVGKDANPGSYSFLVIADPKTRAGVVVGWLTQERGSGLVFSDVKDGKVVVDAQLDYGRVLVRPGETVQAETLLIGYFDDARLGLEAYADAIARHYHIKLPPQPTVYCTWYHAGASNERDLIKNAEFAREHLARFGFSVVQIDDGWQAGVKGNGPRRDFTAHRPDGPYPSGMKQTAEKLEKLGLTPGIWFMPFAGTWNDPFFADKQYLFATKDGKPFEVNWGGTCLDLTNPRTQEYVRAVARRIGRDWGYQYFKLDGLWTGTASAIRYINTGYQDDHLGESTLYDPQKTHTEAYRDGLKIVREAAGQDVFLLGCNVAQNMRTLGASFGLLDAMRIGPDNGRKWPQMCRGPFSGSNLYFLHGRVWYNDPDPMYVGNSVPLDHARALTSWVALTGQLNASSEDFTKLSPERLHLLQRSMPAHGLRARPVDLFEQRIPRIWLLTDERREPRRDVIGLFNWEEKDAARIACPLAKIGLAQDARYVGFDYWADEFVEPFAGTLANDLPAASCRILAVRPVSGRPQVVSTSRHITQGMVDLLEEAWDQEKQQLSGVSRVVANDPYEIRIAAGDPAQPWQVAAATVSSADAAAGAQIAIVRQDGWKMRVRIDSGTSRDIHWTVKFLRHRP